MPIAKVSKSGSRLPHPYTSEASRCGGCEHRFFYQAQPATSYLILDLWTFLNLSFFTGKMEMGNSASLMKWLWRTIELLPETCLEQCLTHSQHSIATSLDHNNYYTQNLEAYRLRKYLLWNFEKLEAKHLIKSDLLSSLCFLWRPW